MAHKQTYGLAEYKQLFQNGNVSDASIFISSLVPVQIIYGDPRDAHKIIRQNQRPSGPRYCRPIKIEFVQETTEILQNDTKYIEGQSKNLTSTNLVINERSISIKHYLVITMIDGNRKAMNAITQTVSAQECKLCGVIVKDFNKLNDCLSKQFIDEQRLLLRLSSLHCGIRFYELNFSYKMKPCKWQARGREDKSKVELEKKKYNINFKISLECW